MSVFLLNAVACSATFVGDVVVGAVVVSALAVKAVACDV